MREIQVNNCTYISCELKSLCHSGLQFSRLKSCYFQFASWGCSITKAVHLSKPAVHVVDCWVSSQNSVVCIISNRCYGRHVTGGLMPKLHTPPQEGVDSCSICCCTETRPRWQAVSDFSKYISLKHVLQWLLRYAMAAKDTVNWYTHWGYSWHDRLPSIDHWWRHQVL